MTSSEGRLVRPGDTLGAGAEPGVGVYQPRDAQTTGTQQRLDEARKAPPWSPGKERGSANT